MKIWFEFYCINVIFWFCILIYIEINIEMGENKFKKKIIMNILVIFGNYFDIIVL